MSWKKGSVASLGEEAKPAFAQRVLLHNPDYVVYLTPPKSAAPALEMLGDKGVRLIVLGNLADLEFRGQRYFLRWEQGFRRVMENWKKRGVTSVLIPRNNGPLFSSVTKQADRWARQAGLECLFPLPGKASWSDYVSGLARHAGVGVVFDEEIFVAWLCSQAPQAIAALIKRAPVLVLRPLDIPYPSVIDGYVDRLTHDWKAIAQRVAHDLDTGRVFSAAPQTVFEADWHPHVPATDVLGRE